MHVLHNIMCCAYVVSTCHYSYRTDILPVRCLATQICNLAALETEVIIGKVEWVGLTQQQTRDCMLVGRLGKPHSSNASHATPYFPTVW